MKENLKKQYLKMIKEIDEVLPVYDYIWEWDKEDWFRHIVSESSNYKGCDLNKLIESKILWVMLSNIQVYLTKQMDYICNPNQEYTNNNIKFICNNYFQYKYFRNILLNYFERGTTLC